MSCLGTTILEVIVKEVDLFTVSRGRRAVWESLLIILVQIQVELKFVPVFSAALEFLNWFPRVQFEQRDYV